MGSRCKGQPPSYACAPHPLPLPPLPPTQALPETNGFLTGETIVVNKAPAAAVRYWDMAGRAGGRMDGCRCALDI